MILCDACGLEIDISDGVEWRGHWYGSLERDVFAAPSPDGSQKLEGTRRHFVHIHASCLLHGRKAPEGEQLFSEAQGEVEP
jgi:hypothetical protein